MTHYGRVTARRAEGFPTAASCRVAGVIRQTFRKWFAREEAGPFPAELAETGLASEIRRNHAGPGGAYGSPRVTTELRRQGQRVNRKRVEPLMRRHGICGNQKRRKPRWKRSGVV